MNKSSSSERLHENQAAWSTDRSTLTAERIDPVRKK
jgi:hypothetical protein